jgi:hypothetical protein
LQKPTTAGLMGLFVSPAMAEDAVSSSSTAKSASNGSFQVAQAAGMQVSCQAKVGSDKLVRVVQEGAKCYRETMSLLKGSVDKREEVACSTKCQ